MRLLLLFIFLTSSCFGGDSPMTSAELEASLKEHIHYSADGLNRIGKIKIDDRTSGINQSTWIYVKNALDYYKKHKPIFIILELNTPGGEVYVAQKISDALKELDTQQDIPVITFINNWAISAGAMLAYSTRYIAVVKDASMGAAEPVLQDSTSGEMKSASEKVNSAIRTDFGNRAIFFNRNRYLAEAMVDKDMIVVMRDGKIIKLDSENQIKTDDPNRDIIISPKGKLLTLNGEELIRYGVADINLKPEKLEPITSDEKSLGVWPAKKELLFQSPFLASIPDTFLDEYQMDWKTLLLTWLTNPVVTSALLFGMMVGFYMEMSTPGFGFAGSLAFGCLLLLILSSFSLEVADWLELIFLISGLLIVAIDLFLFPTFGILGILGTVLFLVGLFGILLPEVHAIDYEFDTKTFNAAGIAFLNRLAWYIGTFLFSLLCIGLLARYIDPSFTGFRRFVLTGNEQTGYTAGLDTKEAPPLKSSGKTVTPLKPSGKVIVENKLYDAMSTGQFIERDTPVEVVGIEGSHLIVKEKRD